jgi:plastocyanin
LPPVLQIAATEITAFHIVGGLLALWALVLSALGVMREDFPGKGSGQRIVMAISALLVVGAIGTAIGTAKDEPKGGEQAGKVNKAGREGTGQPQQGGGLAPGTGANAGQQSGGNAQTAPAPAAPATNLLISADPSGQLRFDKTSLQASAGPVKITMNNPSPVPHDVALEGPGGVSQTGKIVPKGGASEVQATLKAGSYTYFCSVPGHRQAGMEGTLTVK